MKRKKAIAFLIILIVATIFFIIADIFDISIWLPIIENINLEFVSILMNCSVVIGLYLLTFIFVDKSAKKKETNQKDSCTIMLRSIYENCKNSVEILDQKENVVSAVAKCNFNVPNYKDEFFTHLQNYPFEYENQLFQYINSGILPRKEFEDYLNIKCKHKEYITLRITFFDIDEYNDEQSIELLNTIKSKRIELLSLLNEKLGDDKAQ